MGLSISFVSYSRALSTTDPALFGAAENRAKQVAQTSSDFEQKQQAAEAEFESTDQIGKNLVGNVEGRLLWLEMLQALNNSLPKDPEGKRPAEIELRNELHITNLECQKVDDLQLWYKAMKAANWYQVPPLPEGMTPPAPVATAPAGAAAPGAVAPVAAGAVAPAPETPAGESGGEDGAGAEGEAAPEGPTGAGWIVQLTGYHDHNGDKVGANYGAQYVRVTLLSNLFHGKVYLPSGDQPGKGEWVTNKELGIDYPVLLDPGKVVPVRIKDPNAEAAERTKAAMGQLNGRGRGMGWAWAWSPAWEFGRAEHDHGEPVLFRRSSAGSRRRRAYGTAAKPSRPRWPPAAAGEHAIGVHWQSPEKTNDGQSQSSPRHTAEAPFLVLCDGRFWPWQFGLWPPAIWSPSSTVAKAALNRRKARRGGPR